MIMMTITMIGHKGVPSRAGGIERHVEELSTALAMRGMRVISFDRKWYVGDADPIVGVERRWSHGVNTKHLDAITHTCSAIFLARRDRPDIVHIHGVGPSLLAPLARLIHPRAKIVATFHCEDRKHAKWGAVARFMLWLGEACACAFAHRTITVSDRLASYCLETYGCQSSLIPNGVRVTRGAAPELLSNWNLTPNTYFALVTRLIPHKNVHIGIEAHMELAKRRPDLAEAHPLVIVGGSAFTDEYVSELKAFIGSYPNVIMTGEQHGETVKSIQEYALGHLSISSSEGMSLSLLEAMSFAKPVIVSDIRENSDVVETDALLVKTNDVMSLSHAMEFLIEMTPLEREAMGDLLAARTVARHDWGTIAEETQRVYEEVLTNARGARVRVLAA